MTDKKTEISLQELVAIKQKLENHIKRKLSNEEATVFHEIISSAAIRRLEKNCPTLFKASKVDIEALEETLTKSFQDNDKKERREANWTYTAWSYHY